MNKPKVLVAVQFTLIFALALYCGIWGTWWQNAMLMATIGLGVWAVATMRFSVNVLPTVRKNQQLITGGPYKYIRHPMYSAILLATGAWVLNRPNAMAILLWLTLLADLLIKLSYEEQLLTSHFATYKAYKKRTKRIIPFVY